MKLIKVGTAPTCDIILDSEYVSAVHAEIVILDNGELLLTDKDSKNGTYIANKRIVPNQEMPIKRGTPIRFADTELVWGRIPRAENLSHYNAIYNIGSNYRNDIVLNSQMVSRFHASLRIKGGRAYIVDNGSRNGTEVNGRKIPVNQEVQVKRGDNIVCGDEDATMQLRQYIPAFPPFQIAGISIAVVAILGLAVWGICYFVGSGNTSPDTFRSSVVYLRAGYHYEIYLDDDPMKLNLRMRYPEGMCFEQATAFFIDKEGRMGTNRHVAVPWEYRTSDEEDVMHQQFEEYMAKQLKVDIIHLDNYQDLQQAWNRLTSTKLGLLLLADCKSVDELNARIARYRRAKIKIEGVMDYITVGYSGRHYTHTDEFQRCYVVAESGDINKDVAILQLNDKQTPSMVSEYFDINNFYDKELVPLADNLYTIGYPKGISWGLDEMSKSLEPNIRETKCSKESSKYYFEFQASSVEGSSGSPVFNGKGQLVGILSGGYKNASTCAIKAKYLRDLYEEYVK